MNSSLPLHAREISGASHRLLGAMFGCLISTCCLFPDNMATTFAAPCLLFVFLLFLILGNPSFLFRQLAFLFSCAAQIVGAMAIELMPDFWLVELQTYSAFAGSVPLLVFSWWVFFYMITLKEQMTGQTMKGRESARATGNSNFEPVLDCVGAIVLILACGLFIQVLPNPSFVNGVGRFQYAEVFLNRFWNLVSRALRYLVIIPLLQIKNRRQTMGIVSVSLYTLFLLWSGCKFGEYFNIVCLACYVFHDRLSKMKAGSLKKLVVVVFVGMFSLVLFAGITFSLSSSLSIFEFLGIRTSQQGQLWWAIYRRFLGTTHVDEFLSIETRAFFKTTTIVNSVGTHNGIYGAMYLCAPQSVVDAKLLRGSRYTEAGFACAYYYFGALGSIVFAATMALLIERVQYLLLRAFSTCSLLSMFVQARFYALIRTTLGMFLFGHFFTTVSLACLVYTCLWTVMWPLHFPGYLAPVSVISQRIHANKGLRHLSIRRISLVRKNALHQTVI